MFQTPRILPVLLILGALAPGVQAQSRALWTWELPRRKPAWEFTPRMPMDQAHVPVVQGNLVLVGCEHKGALLAIDLQTGAEL